MNHIMTIASSILAVTGLTIGAAYAAPVEPAQIVRFAPVTITAHRSVHNTASKIVSIRAQDTNVVRMDPIIISARRMTNDNTQRMAGTATNHGSSARIS